MRKTGRPGVRGGWASLGEAERSLEAEGGSEPCYGKLEAGTRGQRSSEAQEDKGSKETNGGEATGRGRLSGERKVSEKEKVESKIS